MRFHGNIAYNTVKSIPNHTVTYALFCFSTHHHNNHIHCHHRHILTFRNVASLATTSAPNPATAAAHISDGIASKLKAKYV